MQLTTTAKKTDWRTCFYSQSNTITWDSNMILSFKSIATRSLKTRMFSGYVVLAIFSGQMKMKMLAKSN